MFIKIDSIFLDKKQLDKNKDFKRPIIIIPKKNIKLANRRNKIRRQIRAIMHNAHIFNRQIIVKYFDTNCQPNFQELQKEILSGILYLKKN